MRKENFSIDEFLKNHFKIPSNNFDEIKEFIINDKEMEKIIRNCLKSYKKNCHAENFR